MSEAKSKDKANGLPELDFGTFCMSLASSALVHLGELSHPESGTTKKDEQSLALARQTIDILGILQEKTRGNLTQDEEALLTHLLYDLRMKYVDVQRHEKGAAPRE